MANKLLGEVTLDIEGKQYTLRFGVNGICALEGVTKKGFSDIAMDLAKGSLELTMQRAILWAGLRKYHQEISLEDAGDMLDRPGVLKETLTAFGDAVQNIFPPMTEGEGSRPQNGAGEPVIGTGLNS